MSSSRENEALAPKLTAWDEKLLALLEPYVHHGPAGQGKTVWQVAEALRTEDVTGIRQTLDALCDFGHAWATTRPYSDRQKPRRYFSNAKEDDDV